ncbi:MAG: hypothetical protein A3F43_01495 [Gammaproteobacteria bacterium RIFCSPHIGHO2_12_FULL_42_10]|nr:MAG: hypothetical protein A3F43_01495 [Gammaproteobacteria bacterium RIFCSPHIGHO2_12_FULL_42_10]
MHKTRIGHILSRLLSEKRIRVTELARQINLPQPTVHRIATGICEHPHLSSLKPIADFFDVTIDQLKGFDPIPWLENVTKIPLLAWESVLRWPSDQDNITSASLVLTDANVGPRAYATHLNDTSMDPIFPKGMLLIADPDKIALDRSYVIAKRATHHEPIFRQLLIDAQYKYLKPLNPDLNQYKMAPINEDDKILSVVLQAKRDCEI